MTYSEFVDKMNNTTNDEGLSIADLFTSSFGTLLIYVIVISSVLLLMLHFMPHKYLRHNVVLYKIKRDGEILANVTVLLGFAIGITIVASLIALVVSNSVSSSQHIDIYQTYMDSQEDIEIEVEKYILDEQTVSNKRGHYNIESISNNIYNNAKCENCVEQDVLITINKQQYIMDVLVSYSLEDKDNVYLLTKPRLRENVQGFDKESYYNPILFVPKSERGIK